MKNDARAALYVSEQKHECPVCASTNVQTSVETDSFQYGEESASVELTVEVPFRTCRECDFRYTDSDAEVARHEAVCRHHALMTPREIAELRKGLSLSRAQLADLAGVGSASLARWERGEVLQNRANDRLLYLLGFEDNRRLLSSRGEEEPTLRSAGSPKFRLLQVNDRIRAEQSSFRLRVVS